MGHVNTSTWRKSTIRSTRECTRRTSFRTRPTTYLTPQPNRGPYAQHMSGERDDVCAARAGEREGRGEWKALHMGRLSIVKFVTDLS
ncbi:hypothetical protein EVAR_94995_1 [Eumeta japonica]|uniref:Uncharacterized protein n=1 Tax=Eumeta variegata TaxID=151549 RepID=A0A4C1UV87_EUMVA|nr:hypothetical protein EVAR_94995_1 [Eumeta japonica]